MKEQFDLELFPMMPDEAVVADAFDEAELINEISEEDLTVADLTAQRDAFEKAYIAREEELMAANKKLEDLFEVNRRNADLFNKNMDEAAKVINALGDFHETRLNSFISIIDNVKVLMKGFELPEKGE